jgi:hypothetical protein
MDPSAVAVAQLVEPRVVVPVVAGSSPVRHHSELQAFCAAYERPSALGFYQASAVLVTSPEHAIFAFFVEPAT